MEHPAYSSDLAPSDFHLIGPLKEALGWRRFSCDDDVKAAVHQWLRAQPKIFFADGIKKLVGRWKICIAKQGDYVEKWCNLLLKYLIINGVKKCGNFLKILRIYVNMLNINRVHVVMKVIRSHTRSSDRPLCTSSPPNLIACNVLMIFVWTVQLMRYYLFFCL